jgi:adenylate kinase
MRLFIHHVDSFLGKALVKELRKTESAYHRIFGTCVGDRDGAPSVVKRVVSHDDAKHAKQMEATIQSCKLVVLDLFHATLEDLHFAIRCLKIDPETGRSLGELKDEVMFVLISSVMTWSGTEGAGSGENGAFTEGDYEKRVPAAKFEQMKAMEDLVMSSFNKEGSMVRAFVLSAGILYGQGEDTFNKCFEEAFLCKQQHKIIAPGTNIIPTVHVTDVARLVKQITFFADLTPAEKPYLLAVDKSKLTQAEIVQGIVDEVCEPYKVPIVEDELDEVAEGEEGAEVDEAAQEEKEVHKMKMTLNLNMTPSSLMMVEDFAPQSVPQGWWAQDGILSSIKATAKEFCKERLLQPMRVLISGPPGSGKSTLARGIAEHFNVPHLEMPGASPEHALEQLNSNVCRYRGYVLDSHPDTYQKCDELFMHEKEIVPDEETPAEGEEEGPKIERVVNPDMCPEFVIVLQAKPDLCMKRKNGLDGKPSYTGESDESFMSRMTAYEDANLKIVLPVMPNKSVANEAREAAKTAAQEARDAVLNAVTEEGEGEGAPASDPEAEAAAAASKAYDDAITKAFGRDAQEESKSLTDFFQDVAGRGVFNMQVSDFQDEESMMESARIFMENTTKPDNKKGRPYNYLPYEEEVVEGILEKRQEEEEREAAAKAEEEELARQQTSGKKEEEKREAERARIIAEYEKQRSSIQGVPLREYLMQYMVPSLTEGLIEICKVLPEDPVDYLANYLESHAADGEAATHS